LRIVLHRAIPEDDLLRCQWNDLVQQMEQPEVFYTYEWALAVYRAYAAQMVPLLLLAYAEESLVGVVALATNSSRQTVFLTGTTADYCDFICSPQRREELVTAAFAALQDLGVAKLQLANLPADSVTIPALKVAARRHHYQSFCRPAYFCAQVNLATSGQRDAVKRSLSRKQMVRRHIKGMGKIGAVEVRHLKSPESLAAALPSFMKANTARLLATGRIGNLARAARRSFLRELAGLLSPQGWITMSCLMVGERPVAWNYGFEFGGSWFWYQPTFEPSYQKYYPGLCLLTKMIEQACDRPTVNRVDLGLGEEGYKERMTADGRQTVHVTLTTSGRACWKERARYYAAAAIRSVPQLEGWTRSFLAWAGSLRKQIRREGFRGCARDFARRWQKTLFASSQVFFLEWPRGEFINGQDISPDCNVIRSIDLDLLAVAAMHYADNEPVCENLLSAARRLASKSSQGFALVNPQGVPLHLFWVAEFHKFRIEGRGRSINAVPSNSALIFDHYGLSSIPGRDDFSQAISGVVFHLQQAGKLPWISGTASDPVLTEAEKVGFVRRFSVTRRRVLFATRVIESKFPSVTEPAAKVSSAA
jgi:CelD/BcsL family acetyltransferase involved in cellulose biosynthesis